MCSRKTDVCRINEVEKTESKEKIKGSRHIWKTQMQFLQKSATVVQVKGSNRERTEQVQSL